MGVFRKSDPVADAERDLASLRQREEKIRSRLNAADGELLAAEGRRRDLLVEDSGDDAAVERASADAIAAESRCRGLRSALGELVEQRTAAESALAQARDQAARRAMAATMADAHARIQTALDAHRKAATELVTALNVVTPAGAQLAFQFGGLMGTFAGEIAALLRGLEGQRAALLSGAVPLTSIARTEPAPKADVTAAPTIERMRVFSLTPVRWTDEGAKTAIKFSLIDLPIATARRALGAGAVWAADDRRIATVTDAWGNSGIRAYGPAWQPIPAAECKDLDALDEPVLMPVAEVA